MAGSLPRNLRVGLNLIHAMPEIGGGWNYIGRLVSALGEHERSHTYVAFVSPISRPLVRHQHIEVVPVDMDPRSRSRRILFEHTTLQREATRRGLDLMHWFANALPIFNAVPGVVTVHDLMAFERGSAYGRVRKLYARAVYPRTVRAAAGLLPVSQAAADQLISVLHAEPAKICVIPAILSDAFAPDAKKDVPRLRRSLGLPDRFWLYVAHFYPHKNHVRLLEAYKSLADSGADPWPLVFRGDDHGYLKAVQERVRELGLDRAVQFLPRLAEDDLPALFCAAGAMAFPSWHEGGGMPVLEAMACGCPVVASDIPSLREFGAGAVTFVDPFSVSSIAAALRQVQQGGQAADEALAAGLAAAARHRPAVIAQRLAAAYRDSAVRSSRAT
jgi:glycosyltransferase involved in cell wall biosynthesis